MKKHHKIVLALTLIPCLILAFAMTATAANKKSFDKIFVFGDSLSDIGNLYSMTRGNIPKPPYFLGHFSNGPVWVQYLANDLLITGNYLEDYAVGGAQTSGMAPPSLTAQVRFYKRHHTEADPNALYIIWDGADNYFHDPMNGDKKLGMQAAKTAVSQIQANIQSLYKFGARNFLVMNIPDLALTPIANGQGQPYNQQYQDDMRFLSLTHNALLDKAYKQNNLGISDKNATVMYFDANQLFVNVIQHPKKYGMTNVHDRCWQGSFVSGPDPSLECDTPNSYLFWDIVHPTTYTHKVLAQEIIKTFQLKPKSTVKAMYN